MALYIGLMSGTSLDGLDAVLVEFDAGAPRVLDHVHRPFAPALRSELLALNTSGPDELHRAALAANALVRLEAECVQALLAHAGLPAASVTAIGAHGQTVRHRPGEFDGLGYTLQLHNGALLAELAGIDVVCDFRSRDVAAGGQGAPLVPAFHAAVFAQPGRELAVLNLGGIANLTLLGADGELLGFDCGPANALLDGWCERLTGRPFDEGGAWGAGGQVLVPLLQALMAEPFLQLPPPKSTGRDLFNLAWLLPLLDRHAAGAAAQDVQATLAEFSALAAAEHLRRHAPHSAELLVCGGGVFNTDLLARLAARLPGIAVRSTAEHGVPPTQVEAVAFAWLAQAFTERRPGNRVSVTGAAGPRILGALYPAAVR
jgi:anhydro-N-acetylmuramic acid kinase